MSESKGIKVASLFVGLLLCMVLMQTALATENQNQFTVNFTNTSNMNSSSLTISPKITQTNLATGNVIADNATTGNATNENTNTGNAIVGKTTAGNAAVNSVSPSGYGTGCLLYTSDAADE